MDKEVKKNNKTKDNKKRNIIIITVISILLLISIIGITYSWFSATTNGNDKAKENVIETATLSIKYTSAQELKGENIVPGWSETKTFTVENTGTVNATYSIAWANLLNEFVNKEDLVFTLTSDNNGGNLSETIIPNSGNDINILENITIEPGVTQTYTLTVTYKNTDKDQSSDSGKNLIGKIEVIDGTGEVSNKYKVELNLKNATTTESIKRVDKNSKVEFDITSVGYTNPTVTCTNSQEATIENNKLIINEVTSNTVCNVVYKDAINYTITYDLNGGSLENPINNYTIESENITLPNPSKVGYIFNGWKEGENSTPQKNVTIPKGTHGNKTYTADFSPITYTVKYNANGGEGTISDSTLTYDKASSLPENTLTKEGYEFFGWAITPDATEATYTDAQEVSNLTTENNSIVTLYAVWKIKQYTVNVTVLNGTLSGDSLKTVNHGNNATFSLIPSTGYGGAYATADIECTNNQEAEVINNQANIKNIKNDTTCTIEYYYTNNSCYIFSTINGSIKKYKDSTSCSKDVTIPSEIGGRQVEILDDHSFASMQITSVIIPDTVTKITSYAFYGNKISSGVLGMNIETVGERAFFDNRLIELTIPNKVTTIGNYAFASNQLKSLTLGNNIKTIGDLAFNYNQLTSIIIPDSVISIGLQAFAWNQLTKATIGRSVTDIKERAFDNYSQTVFLTNIINRSGRAFDWELITSGTSGNNFVTGTFTNSNGDTVTISAS